MLSDKVEREVVGGGRSCRVVAVQVADIFAVKRFQAKAVPSLR
jgi:hypothetical protein